MKNPIKYDTGWKKLDAVMSVIAYAITMAGLICFAALTGVVVATHWKLYA